MTFKIWPLNKFKKKNSYNTLHQEKNTKILNPKHQNKNYKIINYNLTIKYKKE